MNRFSLLQQPACTSTICKLQVSKTLATKTTENIWFREFENFPLALREQQSDVQNYERAKIAIIDTGITPDHPDQDMARDYKDFVEESNTIWKDGALHGSTGLYLVAKIALEADVYIDRVLAEQKVQPSPVAAGYQIDRSYSGRTRCHSPLLMGTKRWSPLSFAAANGNETVVQLLLAQEGIDLVSSPIPRLQDMTLWLLAIIDNGRTPLSFAAAAGHDGISKLFLFNGVNPNLVNDNRQTPLSFAAMGGHDEMVKILFAEDTVNPDSKANGFYNKLTLLSLTAEEGHESVTSNDPPADDLNGYGNKDVWIDTDGDGIPDAIDFDGNGFADGDLLDLNKDGVPDAIRLHGVVDIYYLAVTSSTTSQRTLVTSISNPPTTTVTPNAAASSSVAISSDITVMSSSSISESSTEVQTSLPSEASITSGTSILLRSEEAYLQRYHFILRSFFLYHLPDSFTPLTLVSIRPLYSYKLP
ncbi:hypothetical protein TWF703_009059 [Orbilia oligospora]|uniref:Uncharacterized protein n=1 Tax=Orbilia oligospora TaxID=2813651 RepID=A0A7C8JK47_ORBOL|nr:hypothetical protein TWF703_009059 [Orbilia oligospora]